MLVFRVLQRPWPAPGPFGPEVSRERPSGCLWGPSGPGLWSVQKVSRESPRSVKKVSGHSGDTLGTLFGHSGARGPKGPRDTPRDTPGTLQSPRPEGPQRHPEGHSRDTSGPKGPGDSCSRPGALQHTCDCKSRPLRGRRNFASIWGGCRLGSCAAARFLHPRNHQFRGLQASFPAPLHGSWSRMW